MFGKSLIRNDTHLKWYLQNVQKKGLAKLVCLLAMSGLEALGEQPTGTPDSQRIGIADFNFISVLGKGNCAKVLLAETKDSKKLFAIKVFRKESTINNHDVAGTKVEKDILVKATQEKHPFVVQLHAAFQTETRLYLVLEYVSGGDLEFHIQKQDFSPKRAQ